MKTLRKRSRSRNPNLVSTKTIEATLIREEDLVIEAEDGAMDINRHSIIVTTTALKGAKNLQLLIKTD